MTPIPFPLPSARILPPAVAYAAGLICERRPDLADEVRTAVLGDDVMYDLEARALNCSMRKDKQGGLVLGHLRDIINNDNNATTALHGLADDLGLLPWSTGKFNGERWNNGTVWWRQKDDAPWSAIWWHSDDAVFKSPPVTETHLFGHLPIGDVFWYENKTLRICGLQMARFQNQAMALRGSRAVRRYLRKGFGVVWAASKSEGAREVLRHIVPIHAHTVSLNPDTRAAWAKAHIDALTPTIRPQSPDRLT